MRARRPDLYSDTLTFEENSMDRHQFEFRRSTYLATELPLN